MKITRLLLLSTVFTTVLISCSKDDTKPGDENPPSKVQGTWNFTGMTVTGKSVATEDGSTDKTITYNGYISKNNAGTVVIDASKIVSTGITYTVDTVVRSEYYVDGVLDDTFEFPFTFTAPVSGSTAPYKLVGTDSIYFEQGFISTPDNSGTGAPTEASASKISWAGDTLILRTDFGRTTTQDQGGVNVTTVTQGTQVVRLTKK